MEVKYSLSLRNLFPRTLRRKRTCQEHILCLKLDWGERTECLDRIKQKGKKQKLRQRMAKTYNNMRRGMDGGVNI